MLHDVDKTLENLILEYGRIDRNDVDISFEQPNSEWSAQLNRPTINCWCFDLRENTKLRNKDMRHNLRGRDKSQMRAKNGRVPSAQLSLPPMRIDLSFLVTAWARKVEDEHRLLWRALAVFAQMTHLEPEICQGAMRNQPYDMPVSVAQMGETLNNFTDLWSVLDNQMRLGFTITLTVALDLEHTLDVPFALESVFTVGHASDPSKQEMTPDMEVFRRGEIVEDGEMMQSELRVTRDAREYQRGKKREFDNANDDESADSANIINTWLDESQ